MQVAVVGGGGNSVGKESFSILTQTKSNQNGGGRGQNLKLSIFSKVFFRIHYRNEQFIQGDIFSKLAKPGDALPLLLSAWIITKRVVDSLLLLADTHGIRWPSNFTCALS